MTFKKNPQQNIIQINFLSLTKHTQSLGTILISIYILKGNSCKQRANTYILRHRVCFQMQFRTVLINYFRLPYSRGSFTVIFMPPNRMIGCILFLSCLPVVNFNHRFNFWTVWDRVFIFGMYTPLMMPTNLIEIKVIDILTLTLNFPNSIFRLCCRQAHSVLQTHVIFQTMMMLLASLSLSHCSSTWQKVYYFCIYRLVASSCQVL